MYTLFPDYSETMDAGQWGTYKLIPPGGTPVESLKNTANAAFTIEFGISAQNGNSPGKFLEEKFGVKNVNMPLPVGVKATDDFIEKLEEISGTTIPDKYLAQRGRLIDSYVDAHKYVFGVKAAVFGDEDMVAAMAVFLDEIGMVPSICASGAPAGKLEKYLRSAITDFDGKGITVLEDADFEIIEGAVEKISPAVMIGSSKGYKISRKLDIPLIRCAFPVHDRIGGARIALAGYTGTQKIFDSIVNSLLEARQDTSPVATTPCERPKKPAFARSRPSKSRLSNNATGRRCARGSPTIAACPSSIRPARRVAAAKTDPATTCWFASKTTKPKPCAFSPTSTFPSPTTSPSRI